LLLLTFCVLAKGRGICVVSCMELHSIDFKHCVNFLVIRCITIIVSVSRSCCFLFRFAVKNLYPVRTCSLNAIIEHLVLLYSLLLILLVLCGIY